MNQKSKRTLQSVKNRTELQKDRFVCRRPKLHDIDFDIDIDIDIDMLE